MLLFYLYLFLLFTASNTTTSDTFCSWENITVARRSVSSQQRKYILKLSSGQIKSKRLIAIIGPSGSGKSTFLNVISDRFHNSSYMSGYFMLETPSIKADVAFIHQDDAFFSMLTVNETLQLSLDLKSLMNSTRLPPGHQKREVEKLLRSLNLISVANSRVGDVVDRGISGGERKRLSVALQLLGSPRLLIADEPTSGLDSFQALQVVQLLRDIALDKDIPAVVTIHQPSSR